MDTQHIFLQTETPRFPYLPPIKESPVKYTQCPPMTALTSLLLASLVPLGSSGELIWLPPNFEVQVVSGRFVSVERQQDLWVRYMALP